MPPSYGLCTARLGHRMADMSDLQAPTGTRAIRSYHAHIYFRSPIERERALQVRSWIGERFLVQLGRVHDVAVGPHGAPMYQVAFARALFDPLISWLMLNRQGLSVLVHPNTGRALDDHMIHALWLGTVLDIRSEVLTNTAASDVISPIENNTTPTVPGE
jgi:aromatic ring-cleaving dioxygenase